MMAWLLKLFPKRQWRLVTTLEQAVRLGSKEGKVWFHLFEAEDGKKKFDVTHSFGNSAGNFTNAKSTTTYNTKIVPWLNDRYVQGIPKYHEVDMADVEKRLSEP